MKRPTAPVPRTRKAGKKPVDAPFVIDANCGTQQRKLELRLSLGHRRNVIPADLNSTTQWKATNHLRTLLSSMGPTVVALYVPKAGEIDILPLVHELWDDGYTVALPRAVYPGHPLAFNIWHPHTPLEIDYTGTRCAGGEEIWPTVMVVPMLGYNRKGYRLGRGEGYVDATLKTTKIPLTTIGITHTELEIPDFPAEYSDQKLAYIVTGKEVITCQ